MAVNQQRGASVSPEAWRQRRVFLTGHTGFKGSWLSFWLAQMGADVWGYSLPPPTTPALFEALRLADLVHHELGDVRDAGAVAAAMQACRPEVVFHLAAQPLVRDSYRLPLETLATNVLGTAHVLEAARQCPSVRAVVVVTTDKCYDNREWVWGYRESDPLGGHDPYSASKAAAEVVTAAYRASFFTTSPAPEVAIATARAGNVVGGGDWSRDRLVPDAVRAFAAGQTLQVRQPTATRPWQHVLEPLTGYLVLAQEGLRAPAAVSGPWNFGPPDEDVVTVAAFLDTFVRHWGARAAWTVDAGSTAGVHEAHRLKLDTSKAQLHLGWRPRWRLDVSLAATVEWYRAFYDGASQDGLRELTAAQIARHSRS